MIITAHPKILKQIKFEKYKVEDQEYCIDELMVRIHNSVNGNCNLYLAKKMPLDEKAKPKHIERGYSMLMLFNRAYNYIHSSGAYNKSQQIKREFENIKKLIENPLKRRLILDAINTYQDKPNELMMWVRDNIMLYIINQGDAYAL